MSVQTVIEEAFCDLPYPGDDNIAATTRHPDQEAEEIARRFRGKHWRNVPRADLQWSPMPLLTADGFVFYTPAYLLAALDEAAQDDLVDDVVTNLNLHDHLSDRQRRIERFNRFNIAQKRAVAQFLRHICDTPSFAGFAQDATQALDRYWGQYA